MHLLIWKHIVAHMTRIDTEGIKFDPRDIWNPVWIRLERKCLAIAEKAQASIRLAESRAWKPPPMGKRGAPMRPIAEIDDDGRIVWEETIITTIKKLGKTKAR